MLGRCDWRWSKGRSMCCADTAQPRGAERPVQGNVRRDHHHRRLVQRHAALAADLAAHFDETGRQHRPRREQPARAARPGADDLARACAGGLPQRPLCDRRSWQQPDLGQRPPAGQRPGSPHPARRRDPDRRLSRCTSRPPARTGAAAAAVDPFADFAGLASPARRSAAARVRRPEPLGAFGRDGIAVRWRPSASRRGSAQRRLAFARAAGGIPHRLGSVRAGRSERRQRQRPRALARPARRRRRLRPRGRRARAQRPDP